MTQTSSRRALQVLIAGVGAMAAGSGIAVIVKGTAAVPGGRPSAPSIDSELRFFAVWWAALGPVLWRLVPRIEEDDRTLRSVCGLLFLGGVARAAAHRQSGPPHVLFRALTVVELTAPPAIIAWQRSLKA